MKKLLQSVWSRELQLFTLYKHVLTIHFHTTKEILKEASNKTKPVVITTK